MLNTILVPTNAIQTLLLFVIQIVVIDTEGNFRRDLLTDERHSISMPKALAIYDKRLYYLDPRYERLERVDISTGENSKILMDNEPDLKTFTIFRKRPSKYKFILHSYYTRGLGGLVPITPVDYMQLMHRVYSDIQGDAKKR